MNEYPKIIYPEGKKSVRVKSREEALEILGDERLIDRMPGEKILNTDKPVDKPVLSCKWCGKPYKFIMHLKPHERKCEKNPENE